MNLLRRLPMPMALRLAALALGGALAAADAPAVDPAAQQLSEAVAKCDLMQERLTSAITANQSSAELDSLRQQLMDDQDAVIELRYTPLFKTLLTATFANDLKGFRAVSSKAMSDYLTAPILTASSAFLTASVPNQQYTMRYGGTYRRAAQTILFFIVRPVDGGDDRTFTLTVDDGKCSGFAMK